MALLIETGSQVALSWPQTPYVSGDDLEFLILCLYFPSAGIPGICCHAQIPHVPYLFQNIVFLLKFEPLVPGAYAEKDFSVKLLANSNSFSMTRFQVLEQILFDQLSTSHVHFSRFWGLSCGGTQQTQSSIEAQWDAQVWLGL